MGDNDIFEMQKKAVIEFMAATTASIIIQKVSNDDYTNKEIKELIDHLVTHVIEASNAKN